MGLPPILHIPVEIDVPVFVHAWCPLGHSWVTTMTRKLERVAPRTPKVLQTLLATPSCPNCGRAWERCTDTRHGG